MPQGDHVIYNCVNIRRLRDKNCSLSMQPMGQSEAADTVLLLAISRYAGAKETSGHLEWLS